MKELPLDDKIKEFLDQLLPLVNAKLVCQEITIEEFSDSDADYWPKYALKHKHTIASKLTNILLSNNNQYILNF